ncbi:hypothetical protein VB713_17190 [Anabaena cylindrica UHCC 0172]|uniref:hypothetical protein n=1 Tax=Anabaena cylindrica TaxID=1165 RepID=UPI002B20F36F|nr:hypothetical protein [Anabaena cylindrica]MEA5552680.1 hypothetical protein [Anabaena cylindrica UHCC 0172]
MKDKLKNLKDIDFLTELTPSEQEQINGSGIELTSPLPAPVPNGRSTNGMLPPPPEPTPPQEDDSNWYPGKRHQDFLKV